MNPFKRNFQILPNASINSVYIDDVLAGDLFRPSLIIKEIKLNKENLDISDYSSDTELLSMFNIALNSKSKDIKDKATEIAISFGNKLASLLITLKVPSLSSISNRPSWNDIHWNYWNSIERVYFVGGLTSPILTSIFYKQIQLQFEINNINDLKVSFIEGSAHLGTKGLSTLINNGEYLLFDFGQTFIKRRHTIKLNGEIIIDSVLDSLNSQNLLYKNKNKRELIESAAVLHKYIVKIITETMDLVDFKGNEIYMAIANYVYDGTMNKDRGGYSKLAYLDGGYEELLIKELSRLANRDIRLKLFHDTSAMALNFTKSEKTAVISLGTAFGIAFPE